MAMPDDWIMIECCRCYTVGGLLDEKIWNNEFLITDLIISLMYEKLKWQSLIVRVIRYLINMPTFNIILSRR